MTAKERIQSALQEVKAEFSQLISELDASVAETLEEISTLEARTQAGEEADRQKAVEAVARLQVRLDALKVRARELREADAARFREAKAKYDDTLAVFVDKRDAGEMGLN